MCAVWNLLGAERRSRFGATRRPDGWRVGEQSGGGLRGRSAATGAGSAADRDDVRAVAEDEGIPIYVISTNEVNKDPISSGVFRRIAQRTGGKAYWARTWQKQVEAFESIREDMSNSYTVTYYPAPNPNEGFRKISVEVVSDPGKKLRIKYRPGYRPTKIL